MFYIQVQKGEMHYLEVWFYFLVWMGHIVYGFIEVYKVSSTYSPYIYSGFFEPGWNILGGSPKDVANYEWYEWIQDLRTLLPIFLLHSFVKNIINLWYVELLFWFIAHYVFFGQRALVLSVVVALIFCFIITFFLEYLNFKIVYVKILLWFVPLLALWVMAYTRYSPQPPVLACGYKCEVLLSYKFMQYISYTFDYCDGKVIHSKCISANVNSFTSHVSRLLYYSFYFPYSTILICPYHRFRSQILSPNRPKLTYLVFFACRIVFWFLLGDFILHVAYFNAFMLSPHILNHVPLASLCSIGYFAGQFFHVKYVVMFGTFAFFAFVDGMNPDWSPVCISRVSLYSRMWRYFDRGLYSFLREYVYRSVCTPDYATQIPLRIKRVASTVLTFGFVWLWHGGSTAFMYWVLLNICEILLESGFAKVLPISLKGEGWGQRLACLAHIPCTLLGILAIAFFLGEHEGRSGSVFVRRILLDNFAYLKYPAFNLMGMLYCYAQCCIYLEKSYGF